MASVFYSVCPSGPDLLTGSPTLDIASGVATFSVAQTAATMGVGVEISYNDGTAKKCYVSGKTSTSVWTVVTALGANPADCTGASVSGIAHCYASMSAAEAGCNDSNHTNNTDITAAGANVNVMIPCYCEQSGYTADTTVCTWNAMTGDATHRVYVYSPTSTTTECNTAMFPTSPKYDATKYRLLISDASSCILFQTTAGFHYIRNLQIYSTYTGATALALLRPSASLTQTFNCEKNILIVTLPASGSTGRNCWSISASTATSPVSYVVNNIMIALSNAGTASAGGACYQLTTKSDANMYVYENTIYGPFYAPIRQTAGVVTAYNNCFIGGVRAIDGTTTDDYNTYDINESETNGTLTTQTDAQLFNDVTDASPLNWNYTPLSILSDLYNKGSTLGSPYNEDILGTSRPQQSTYDNGAVELLVYPPTVTSISPATGTTAGGTAVTITGTNFSGSPTVTIGGFSCTSVVVVNTTTITAVTGAATTIGSFAVTVTIGALSGSGSSFTYTLPAETPYSLLEGDNPPTFHTPRIIPSGDYTPETYQKIRGNVDDLFLLINKIKQDNDAVKVALNQLGLDIANQMAGPTGPAGPKGDPGIPIGSLTYGYMPWAIDTNVLSDTSLYYTQTSRTFTCTGFMNYYSGDIRYGGTAQVLYSLTGLAHGVTAILPTDSYGGIFTYTTGSGAITSYGLRIEGIGDGSAAPGIFLDGGVVSASPTLPGIMLTGYKKSGTGGAALAATETVLRVDNYTTTGLLTLKGNGQLALSITTGTSPFSIASTTVNTNLNSDLIDGVHVDTLTDTYIPRYESTGTKLENSRLLDDGTRTRVGASKPLYLEDASCAIGFNGYLVGGVWKYGIGSSSSWLGNFVFDTSTGVLTYRGSDAAGNADASAVTSYPGITINNLGYLTSYRSIYIGNGGRSDPGIGYLLIDNQIISYLATGTAPLDVASTTLCTNLNAEHWNSKHLGTCTDTRLMRYNSTGTQIESSSITESSGALGGITTLSMSGALSGLTTIVASSTIQCTTIKCTDLTDNYIPKHVNDTSGFANSVIYDNGSVGINQTDPQTALDVAISNASGGGRFFCYDDAVGSFGRIQIGHSLSDTINTLVETTTDTYLGELGFLGCDTTPVRDYGARILTRQNGAAGTRVPTDLFITTFTNTAENSNQLMLSTAGDVRIGKSLTIGNATTAAGDNNLLVDGTIRRSTSANVRYYHIALESANPGASGATWVDAGANTTGGWQINAATELLRGQADVHADWDGASDLSVEVKFAVNVDNSGGGAGDTVDLKIACYYKGTGDTATKSQTVENSVVVGASARYKQFTTTFTIDWDYASNVVEVGDLLSFVMNIETDTSEVDDVIITGMTFYYLTTHVSIELADV